MVDYWFKFLLFYYQRNATCELFRMWKFFYHVPQMHYRYGLFGIKLQLSILRQLSIDGSLPPFHEHNVVLLTVDILLFYER